MRPSLTARDAGIGGLSMRDLLSAPSQCALSRRDDFQLLDQSVHLQRLSMSRDSSGRWRLWRQYRFEYSFDGVERRQGHVIMLGNVLQAVVTQERPQVLH